MATAPNSREERVDIETATAEFLRFLDAMDLDPDPASLDEDDRKGFDLQKATVIRSIQRGDMVINDDGEPVFCPTSGDRSPITFYEPTGSSYMASDRRKKGQDIGKMYAVMADATKQPAARFANMRNRDVKVCQAVITLFLG